MAEKADYISSNSPDIMSFSTQARTVQPDSANTTTPALFHSPEKPEDKLKLLQPTITPRLPYASDDV